MLKSEYQNLSSYWNVWLSPNILIASVYNVSLQAFLSQFIRALWRWWNLLLCSQNVQVVEYMGRSEKGTSTFFWWEYVNFWPVSTVCNHKFKNIFSLKDWSFLHKNIWVKHQKAGHGRTYIWCRHLRGRAGESKFEASLASRVNNRATEKHWFGKRSELERQLNA